jgi:hypothetical protein
LAVIFLAPDQALAVDPLEVRHEPILCVLSERYPQLDACVEPVARVGSVRAYFRSAGADKWHHVEMKPVGTCFRATLPAPLAGSSSLRYYLLARHVLGVETRTREQSASVVAVESSCPGGIAAPFLSEATVAVLGGGAPVGFLGGGSSAGWSATAMKVGAGVAGAGVLVAAVAGAGGEGPSGSTTGAGAAITSPEPPVTTTTTTATTTTSTRPPAPAPTTTTTTTPAPPPTTITTTTTTTTQPTCAQDSAAPAVAISRPSRDQPVGTRVEIEVDARDPGAVASGIDFVRLYAEEQNGARRSAEIAVLRGSGPLYLANWALPACRDSRERWRIHAEAVDHCQKTARADVRIERDRRVCGGDDDDGGDGFAPAASRGSRVTSDLAIPDGQGQVVINGAEVAFPTPGPAELALSSRLGANRVEALLVQGSGKGGTWRFEITGARPGSLRALAGEPVSIAGDTIVFRLRGRPAERVVFAFEVD